MVSAPLLRSLREIAVAVLPRSSRLVPNRYYLTADTTIKVKPGYVSAHHHGSSTRTSENSVRGG